MPIGVDQMASVTTRAAVGEQSHFRLGDWTVEPALNQLERRGQLLRIEPRAMDVLVYLADHVGQTVTTETLISDVWSGRAVGDGSVYFAINHLRKALGDDRETPRYLETIPKRGYRLIAPVERVSSQALIISALGYKTVIALLAVLTVITVPTVALLSVKESPDHLGAAAAPSIAVLPFEKLSPNAEVAYFAAGIHNDLLTSLSKISSLTVISRTSVLEYTNRPRNLREIGRELGVGAILEGSVQRSGEMVRVNVQLIDAQTDEHLWAEFYDRSLTADSLFAIQTEMATSIATALRATLTPTELDRLQEVPTLSGKAYDHYLTGRDYAGRPNEAANMPLAIEAFEQAVAEDPNFARAWAELSQAHSELYRFGGDPTDERRRRAETAVQRAVALEPDAPEVRAALARYNYLVLFDNEAALREFELARRAMPGSAEVFNQLAGLYRRMGRWDEALSYRARAIELDPRNTDQLISQAATYARLHDYMRATRLIDRALEISPDNAFLRQSRALQALWSDGDVAPLKVIMGRPSIDHGSLWEDSGWLVSIYDRNYAQALADLDAWDMDEFAGAPKSLYLGETYRLAGQLERAQQHFETARSYLRESLAASPEDYWIPVFLAQALAGLHDAEGAVALGRRVLESMPTSKDALLAEDVRRSTIFRVFLPARAYEIAMRELDALLSQPSLFSIEGLLPDPRLDPVRDRTDFQALVKKYQRR